MIQKEAILEYLKAIDLEGRTRQEVGKELNIRETSVDRAINELIRDDLCIEIGGKKNDQTASPAKLVYAVTPYMTNRAQKNWFSLRKADECGQLFLMCQAHEAWLRRRLGKDETLFQIGTGTTGRPKCHYCKKGCCG